MSVSLYNIIGLYFKIKHKIIIIRISISNIFVIVTIVII